MMEQDYQIRKSLVEALRVDTTVNCTPVCFVLGLRLMASSICECELIRSYHNTIIFTFVARVSRSSNFLILKQKYQPVVDMVIR